MEYNYQEIGERFRKERKQRKWSQYTLLEELNLRGYKMGRNTLSSIENGVFNNVSFQQIIALSDIYNRSLGYFIGEYEEHNADMKYLKKCLKMEDKTIQNIMIYTKDEKLRTIFNNFFDSLLDNFFLTKFLILYDEYINNKIKYANIVDDNGNYIDLFTNDMLFIRLQEMFAQFLKQSHKEEKTQENADFNLSTLISDIESLTIDDFGNHISELKRGK